MKKKTKEYMVHFVNPINPRGEVGYQVLKLEYPLPDTLKRIEQIEEMVDDDSGLARIHLKEFLYELVMPIVNNPKYLVAIRRIYQ